MAWDDPLGPLAEIVAACSAGDDAGHGIALDRLTVEMPLELHAATSASGEVVLAAAPPRQALDTTVMPVLHRIRLVMEVTR